MLLGVGRSPMSNEAFLSVVYLLVLLFATVALTIMKKWRGLREICNLFTVIFWFSFCLVNSASLPYSNNCFNWNTRLHHVTVLDDAINWRWVLLQWSVVQDV